MSLDGCCRSGTVGLVSADKLETATSTAPSTSSAGPGTGSVLRTSSNLRLRSLLALGVSLTLIGGLVASEVYAGGILNFGADELPIAELVDADTLARAQSFAGEYTFIGGQKERDGVDAAIETTLQAVSPVVRNLGRERLQAANVVPQNVEIKLDGDQVNVLFDGHGHEAGLDGVPIKTQSREGDKVKVSYRMRGAQLVELTDGVGGDRTNEFKLNADASRLTMDVEISSSQLPVPVTYRLTFKRK